MKAPLISVVTPCYKQAKFLNEALHSVLEQTYSNWECIIINDGSPDNTKEIAFHWTSKDQRFKYIEQQNLGVSSARNKAISCAKGEFILPLDADDKISPLYLELAIEKFRCNPSVKVVYGKAEKFGKDVGLWQLKPFELKRLASFNMIYCSAVFRKNDWKAVGGYDENMVDGIEDWEFWISILKNGGTVYCLDEIVFFYRIKESSRTVALNQQKLNKLYEYLSIKHPDFFTSQKGSFIFLDQKNKQIRDEHRLQLKSRKFVIDLFCYTFFGFSVFDKYPLKEEKNV